MFLLVSLGCLLINMLSANPIDVEMFDTNVEEYSNATQHYDVINIDVINSGPSDVTAEFSLYLEESTDLIRFNAEKRGKTSSKTTKTSLKPINFTDDLFHVENEVGMSKMSLGSGESGNFGFIYESHGGVATKRTNKFFLQVELDTEDPQQTEVIVSSANFNVSGYPPNSKHSYLFVCHQGYTFNLRITDFDVEEDLDRLTLLSISSSQSASVVEEIRPITSVGTVETGTNQLLIRFRTDCDTSLSGFRGVLTAVRSGDSTSTQQNSTPSLATTSDLMTTQMPAFETNQTVLGKGKSCKDIKDSDPSSVSGIYQIEVDGEKLEVRCEMNSASGGWTIFHNRYDGSVAFNRGWLEYENGFGSLNGEFWLGLKHISELTKSGYFDLRVEMSSHDGRFKFAQYKEFRVHGATENYKISFKDDSYTGDAGDSLLYANNAPFSTYDNDHDTSSSNYAANYGANWWKNICCYPTLNGIYESSGVADNEYMHWYHFDNNLSALKTMKWMFRQV